MELKELKARAYDMLVQLEYLQVELRKANQAIAEYKEPESSDEKVL